MRQPKTFKIGAMDKRVLLSGAGLSRNWGGYLASEMWGAILSDPRVQERRELRELLLREMNFETALAAVQLRPERFDAESQRAMNDAVREAFLLQDANNCHELSGPAPSSWTTFADRVVRQLVGRDQHDPDLMSFFFTLNQDILFERGFMPPTPDPPNMPSVAPAPGLWQMSSQGFVHPEQYHEDRHRIRIPREVPTDFEFRGGSLNYVKLHGSFNWDDGDNAMMVLGGGKREAIARFPLLQAYFDLFQQVLTIGKVRLLVIGYSFHDDHVNELIADAVRTAQLKLVIVDPRPPRELRNQLLLDEFGEIWAGIVDYITLPPAEIFGPRSQRSLSGEVQRIARSFLDYAM